MSNVSASNVQFYTTAINRANEEVNKVVKLRKEENFSVLKSLTSLELREFQLKVFLYPQR